MKEKIPIYLSRIIMFGLIIGGLWWLYDKYSTVTILDTPPTETTTLPIVVLLFIGLIVLILCIGLATQMLFAYGEYIKKHWLSFQAFAPFLLIIIGVTVFAKMTLYKVILLVEINVTQFMSDLNTYNETTTNMLYWFGGAFIVGLIGFLYEQWLNWKIAHNI